MNRFLHHLAFVTGLAAVCWVGVGFAGSNPLALAITTLIAAFYLMGAFELHRFHQATSSLTLALSGMADPLPGLSAWLERVPLGLRNAVRLRVEGERVGLPGPALTPYLAGLLVLLGMLGTFLGMVVTLNGTGIALDTATDLQAIRASLSAPVRGLGLAFGTSIAGVAASAMLGLMSALSRRERLQSAQLLDTKIATTLRPFSLSHQREQSFKLLQAQAEVMPALVDRLQTMITTMERQGEASSERLIASQERFHSGAESAYGALAASVDRSLQASLVESARLAGATIQPVVEATMAGIARESTVLHDTLASTVQRQLEGLSTRFEATTAKTADLWKAALDQHQVAGESLSQDWRASSDRFAETFEQRSALLVERVSTRLEGAVTSIADSWRETLDHQQRVSESQSSDTQAAMAAAAAEFEQRSAALLRTVDQTHTSFQSDLASREQQRLSVWTDALGAMASSLEQQWKQAGEQTLSQQALICKTLAETAHDITEQSKAHGAQTMVEIGRLMQAAAEAPRAAADVIAELRQKLSDSMARDNEMLEERHRILETMATLLDAVNHASTDQRTAIDDLVASSADLMERVGLRFNEKAEAAGERLDTVAAQITTSAVEVASLGEAFGFAVQLFSQSNDKLLAQLHGIEGALSKSMVRSDEQLAYYVAQAREVIDLSIMSQKQIVDDLQQLARQQAPVAA